MPRFYTTDEVAETLRVKTTTVRKWIKKGIIITVRVGHEYLIPTEEIVRLTQQASEVADV